ncbi:MAG: hypothetical protein DRO39_07675 [Thermoprotei archaeon]|nr:MAG: hypothetical protein DRO39_07675 [Thermoprotei archaeon]
MEFRDVAIAVIIVALLLPIIITTVLVAPIIPAKPAEKTYSVDFSFLSSYRLYWLNYERSKYEVWAVGFSLTTEGATPVVLAMVPEPSARPLAIPALGDDYFKVPIRLTIWAYEGDTQASYSSVSITLQFPQNAPHGYELQYCAEFSLLLKPGRYTIVLDIDNALFGGYLGSLTYTFELFEDGSFTQPALLTPVSEQEPPPEPEPGLQEPSKYVLSISAVGPGTTDPKPGSYTFDEGTKVVVRAIPHDNARFKEWIVDGKYRLYSTEISIEMYDDHSATAYFEEVAEEPPPEETGTIYVRTYLGRGSSDGVWMTKGGRSDLGTPPEYRPTDLSGHKAHVVVKLYTGEVLAELDTDEEGYGSAEIPKLSFLSLRVEATFTAFGKELKVHGSIEASSAYFGGTVHIAKALPDAKLTVSLARYRDGRYVPFDKSTSIRLELLRYGMKIGEKTASSNLYFPQVTLSVPFYKLPGRFSVRGSYGGYVVESGEAYLPDPWSADCVGLVFAETPVPEREFPVNVKTGHLLVRSTIVLPDGSVSYVRSFVRINYQAYGSDAWYFDYEAYTNDDGTYVIIPVEACGKYYEPWPFDTWRTKYGVKMAYAFGKYEHYEELVVEPDKQYTVEARWEQKPTSTLAFIGVGLVDARWLVTSLATALVVLIVLRRMTQ